MIHGSLLPASERHASSPQLCLSAGTIVEFGSAKGYNYRSKGVAGRDIHTIFGEPLVDPADQRYVALLEDIVQATTPPKPVSR
jgi:hypothetical protein